MKRWMFVVPVLLGVGAVVFLVNNRDHPVQAPAREQVRTVRVIEAPSLAVVPRAVGFGSVIPGTVWEAVAEVSGRVVERHPRLEVGAILPAGTVLLRIDRTDYELALAQLDADLLATEAQLAEMEIKVANTEASIRIEAAALALGEKELARNRRLAAAGTVARSDLERAERNTLAQRQSLQSLRNSRNLLPAERRLLTAQRERQRAQREGARVDLERTTITLPIDGHIAETHAEVAQYVREGELLVVADGIDVAEIDVRVPIGSMRGVVRSREGARLDPARVDLQQLLGLTARARLQDLPVEWEARFVRISPSIDAKTRTIGVIVQVDDPYRQARPGIRPPLVKGMFLEVELTGRPLPDQVVVPRTALHADRVYVVGKDNRLERRLVEVGIRQPGFLTITAGLAAGERVVVSDLSPAIEGMLTRPVPDEETAARLRRAAAGTDR